MNLLKIKDLSKSEILTILKEADEFSRGKQFDGLEGKKVANLFFENSTRTHYSFQMAQLNLNMKVLSFNPQASSIQKGESLYDTVKTFESIGADLLVIRHEENEYFNQLSTIKTPIINAGDGTANHPTQCLLDLLTIYQEYQSFEGLKIAIVGDIAHSRVAHSNIEVMQRLGMEVFISGPEEFNDQSAAYIDFDQAVKQMDVIMLLRVQNERHQNLMQISNQEYNQKFGLNANRVSKMKENAIILHPAPFNRGVELTDEVVECDKSRIFKQMQNGVFVRMTVIKNALTQ